MLTWDGEVSAVSRDAIQDSRWARAATVIDDWDEEFDRGKVRPCSGLASGGPQRHCEGRLGVHLTLRGGWRWQCWARCHRPGRSECGGHGQGVRPPLVCSFLSEVGTVGTTPAGHT